jgi:hypothetical protein
VTSTAHAHQKLPPDPSEDDGERLTRLDWAVAVLSTLAILAHDAAHVVAGRYWDVFWICNVAAALVGPAILLRSPLLSAVAVTWLVPGTIVWLADAVVAGSNILPTSYAVHLGGTAAAVYATRRAGFAPRGWMAAVAVLAASVVVSRLSLPAVANVNAAHAIPRGWGFLGRSRATFAFTAVSIAAAACLIGRAIGRVSATRR